MHDMIIIGSGLAGSSMACALAQSGWDVLLVERQSHAQHKVCGEFLSPESQASLRELGLYDPVAALQPVAIPQATLTTMRGTALNLPLPGQAWGLSRYALDATLLKAAEDMGVKVLRGATVTNLQVTPQSSQASIRSQTQQTTVSARLAVIACGRNPLPGLRADSDTTRIGQQSPQSRSNRLSYVGAKCHYTGIDMPRQCELFLFEDGYLGVSPVETGAVNVCMLISKAGFRRAGATVAGAIHMAMAANPALAQRLAPGTALPGSSVAVAPVDTHRQAQPWGPTARIGDAVSMIPPLCGDGMAMALRSAQLAAPLAHAMLQGKLSFDDWMRAHTSTWRHEFSARIRIGRILQTMLARPWLSDLLLSMGRSTPNITRQIVAMTRG